MAESGQYLRIGLAGADFLLPSSASFAIEQREHLVINDTEDALVSAWRVVQSARWPAYCLDHELEPVMRDDWQRAVFLEAAPHPVGLIANELQLLSREEVVVEPFMPLGAPPTAFGHLFNAAWVQQGTYPVLVFEPRALAGYLQQLGKGNE